MISEFWLVKSFEIHSPRTRLGYLHCLQNVSFWNQRTKRLLTRLRNFKQTSLIICILSFSGNVQRSSKSFKSSLKLHFPWKMSYTRQTNCPKIRVGNRLQRFKIKLELKLEVSCKCLLKIVECFSKSWNNWKGKSTKTVRQIMSSRTQRKYNLWRVCDILPTSKILEEVWHLWRRLK